MMEVKLVSKVDPKTGKEYWEGTVSFTDLGLAPTKLRKTDGSTQYSNKAAVSQAARNLAKKLDYEANVTEPSSLKKAAKKSISKTQKVLPRVVPPWVN